MTAILRISKTTIHLCLFSEYDWLGFSVISKYMQILIDDV